MRYVALLRGINVGRAKRVPMADLRAAVEALGATDVSTLLNSGNVVFSSGRRLEPGEISAAVEARTGVSSVATVLTGAEVKRIASECSLEPTDPSRLMVAVTRKPAAVEPLLDDDWAPEALAIGSLAAYLWCPDGVVRSALGDAVNERLGDAVTARNWRTFAKVVAAL